MSFSILVSSGYMPSSGTARSYGGIIPSFLRNLHTIFHSVCNQFTLIYIDYRLFVDGHSDWCEVVSCSFDFHFSNNE